MGSKFYRDFKNSVGAKSEIWELFHENTKMGLFYDLAPREMILDHMDRFVEALDYSDRPEVKLPERIKELTLPLSRAIQERMSARDFSGGDMSFEDAAALLHYGYGINRTTEQTGFPRGFRNCPSGGGLFPLEVYVYASQIEGLEQGTYHYSPVMSSLRRLNRESGAVEIRRILVQPELHQASMLIFITAQFERCLFKYQDRGYRFILLEAGHLAQNVNLVAAALDLGCVNVGGYFDRRADKFLDLDGLTHSTIYMIALGPRAGSETKADFY